MELTELERLQRQVEGMRAKIKEYKALKTAYALSQHRYKEALNREIDAETDLDRYRRALEAIQASDELVSAARMRRFAEKTLSR